MSKSNSNTSPTNAKSTLGSLIRATAYSRQFNLNSYGVSKLSTKVKVWVKDGSGTPCADVTPDDILECFKGVSIDHIKEFTREDTNLYLEYLWLFDITT